MGEPTSSALKLFGTDEPVPETPLLRAGPLEASLDAGNLRHIKLGGSEAIRAISYIVRDRNWGTYNPEISNLRVEQDPAGFRVSYDAVCRDAQQAFAYRATITADARGQLSFAVDGRGAERVHHQPHRLRRAASGGWCQRRAGGGAARRRDGRAQPASRR